MNVIAIVNQKFYAMAFSTVYQAQNGEVKKSSLLEASPYETKILKEYTDWSVTDFPALNQTNLFLSLHLSHPCSIADDDDDADDES